MAIGQRIKFFRNRKGLTQKQLGETLGFLGRTSDVRLAQYESEARVPKLDLIKEMAGLLGVNMRAINVPDIDSNLGLMHTLFALEDMYGIKVGEIDGEMCLRIDKSVTVPGSALSNMLTSWNQQAGKLVSGEITKDEYDDWRYNYPDKDTSPHFAKVISPGLNDLIMQERKKIEKEEQKETKKKKKK